MPERNKLQAQFPRGSRVVPNPDGTAPGIDLTVPRSCGPPCRVFALPGVPAEMFTMWNETVGPALAASQPSQARDLSSPDQVLRRRRERPRGDAARHDPPQARAARRHHGAAGRRSRCGSRPAGRTKRLAGREMEPTVAQIREILGVLVFGEEDDELEHAVVRLLKERGRTLAVAEWATDGLVSQWLAEAAVGESIVFAAGSSSATLEMLKSLLNMEMSPDAAAAAETAAAMARSCPADQRCRLRTWHRGVPSRRPAVPTAATLHRRRHGRHVARGAGSRRQCTREERFRSPRHPAITKTRSAKQALNMVRLALLNREATIATSRSRSERI